MFDNSVGQQKPLVCNDSKCIFFDGATGGDRPPERFQFIDKTGVQRYKKGRSPPGGFSTLFFRKKNEALKARAYVSLNFTGLSY